MSRSLYAADAPTLSPTIPTSRSALLKAIQTELSAKFGLPSASPLVSTTVSPAGLDVAICRLQYEEAALDTRALYRLIYFHLKAADQLVTASDVTQQRTGIGIASAAATCAADRVKNPWLAALIYHATVLPHLLAADPAPWQDQGQESLLMGAIKATASAGAWADVVPLYQRMIQMTKDAKTADAARIRLADVLGHLKRYDEAIQTIDAVDATARGSVAALRATLVQKRDAAKK